MRFLDLSHANFRARNAGAVFNIKPLFHQMFMSLESQLEDATIRNSDDQLIQSKQVG